MLVFRIMEKRRILGRLNLKNNAFLKPTLIMKRIYVNKTTYYVLSLSMMLFILCGYKPKKVDKDSEDLGLKIPLMGWAS